jgi:ubiquinone/menaquinone biosynthesis C-methylase UbiE
LYDREASTWSLQNRNPVVGSYDAHNEWKDYDTYLFKDFDTQNLTCLEYGCGPGRNLVRFSSRFKQVDGTDISDINIQKAKINLEKNNVSNSEVFPCDGKSIPRDAETYDVVFSVICLQHIACYDIRFNIFQDIYRVLKPGGKFCFQMGFNGKKSGYTVSTYHENAINARSTNGMHDVAFNDEQFLKDDLLVKLDFKNYKSDIRPTGPGDAHLNWIWVQVEK